MNSDLEEFQEWWRWRLKHDAKSRAGYKIGHFESMLPSPDTRADFLTIKAEVLRGQSSMTLKYTGFAVSCHLTSPLRREDRYEGPISGYLYKTATERPMVWKGPVLCWYVINHVMHATSGKGKDRSSFRDAVSAL